MSGLGVCDQEDSPDPSIKDLEHKTTADRITQPKHIQTEQQLSTVVFQLTGRTLSLLIKVKHNVVKVKALLIRSMFQMMMHAFILLLGL